MIPYYDIECLKLELAEGTIAIHFTLFFFPKKFNNKRAIVNGTHYINEGSLNLYILVYLIRPLVKKR